MAKCCKNWLDKKCQPKNPRSGRFTEIQACPTCGTRFKVTFEEIAVLGDDGNSEYAVVAADPV